MKGTWQESSFITEHWPLGRQNVIPSVQSTQSFHWSVNAGKNQPIPNGSIALDSLFPVTKFTIWKEVLQVTAEWVICGSCADAQMHSLAEEIELQRCRETVMLGQLQLDKQLLDYIMDCLALFLIRICHSAEKRWTITYKQKFLKVYIWILLSAWIQIQL